MGYNFLDPVFFSLLLPIGKRSTLAKIWGSCSPLWSLRAWKKNLNINKFCSTADFIPSDEALEKILHLDK